MCQAGVLLIETTNLLLPAEQEQERPQEYQANRKALSIILIIDQHNQFGIRMIGGPPLLFDRLALG